MVIILINKEIYTMKKKSNLLIIISDELRRDALSIYGDTNACTPNIDALAESGVRFNNACSTYPVCVPFRYSLMTGQYAHRCMVPTLGWRMSPAERTLADEFNDAGYQTAYFGKWHLYGGQINIPGYSAVEEGSKPVPRTHQGRWQYWRGFDLRNSFFDTNYFINDDPTPHKINGYQTDGLADLTIDFIKNKRDKSKPFCCVLSVEPPHPPYEAPKELEEKWLSRDIDLPPNFMKKTEDSNLANHGHSRIDKAGREQAIKERKLYYAMIENLDVNTGRVTQALKDAGVYDNTFIIFMSDHGELGGSHHINYKQLPYEESVGIPLIISGPEVSPMQVDTPVCTEDLFPTILGLPGVAHRDEIHGCDLSALINGEAKEVDRPGVLLQFIWEPRRDAALYKQIWRGFRSQRYKYTVLGDIEQGLKPWQFFDLKKDPYELKNLINSPGHEEFITQHQKWMQTRMIEVGDDEVSLLNSSLKL